MDDIVHVDEAIPPVVEWIGRWRLASLAALLGTAALALLDLVALAQ